MTTEFKKSTQFSCAKQKMTFAVSMALGVAFGTALKSIWLGAIIAFALWYSSNNRKRR
jgi:ABC-type spermidine/putrescine transport system permease subunit II